MFIDLLSAVWKSRTQFLTKFIFLVLCYFCAGVSSFQMITNISRSKPTAMFAFQLPSNYEKDFRPSKKPVDVEFEIHVQAINPIKAADMDFSELSTVPNRMELLLAFRWVDPRLVFSDAMFQSSDRILLPNEFIDLIWHPDPFLANAKSTDVGQLTQKLINVFIFRNQSVSYSVIMFATVACAMQFQYYPFDYQLCPTVIESFSYDETEVKYTWSNSDALTINPKVRLLQFQVTYPLRVEECSIRRVKEVHNVSQLVAYFRFDRLLGNHLIQTFAPCSLVVSLSWLSFWLELDAISARVSLLVTTMLTLVTQFSGLKADFPPVAYVKAVDIWMAGCMVFVFGALGEFVVVKVICSLTEDAKIAAGALANQSIDQDSTSMTSLVSPAGLSPKENAIYSQPRFTFLNGIVSPQVSTRVTPKATITQRKKLGSGMIKKLETSVEYPDLTLHFFGENGFGLPLVWTNFKTLKHHILWREIDNVCRWLFPASFCLFLFIYWMVLFIHSRLNSPSKRPPSYCG